MTATSSEFLLIFRESAPERYAGMSADERRAALADWNAWCQRLVNDGIMKDGHPLQPTGRVIGGATGGREARGGRAVDGPFTEAKELVGGYFFIVAADLDEAAEIAEGSPNLRYGQTVEVRPISEACHLARSLGLRSNRDLAPASSGS